MLNGLRDTTAYLTYLARCVINFLIRIPRIFLLNSKSGTKIKLKVMNKYTGKLKKKTGNIKLVFFTPVFLTPI